MSSTAPTPDLRWQFWSAFAGGRGPLLGVAAFLLAIWCIILSIPAAAWLILPVESLSSLQFTYDVPWPWVGLWLLIGLAILVAISLIPRLRRRWLRVVAWGLVAGVISWGAMTFLTLTARSIADVPATVGKMGLVMLISSSVPLLLHGLLWSGRIVCSTVLRTLLTPSSALGAHGLSKGLIGAGSACLAAVSVALVRGADWSIIFERSWFFLLIMPVLIGFGWTAPWPSRPSSLFAMVCGIAILTVIPGMLVFAVPQWHSTCPRTPNALHEILDYSGEPWKWGLAREPSRVVMAPVMLVELTIWHIIDPSPERRC